MLKREGAASLGALQILEVGCGTGNWLRDVVRWGARPENVHGVDLLTERVDAARRSVAPGVTVSQGDISALSYPDATFDLVIQSTVFSSIIDDARRQRAAAEMRRVLRPGGFILWYDLRVDNPANPNVRAIPPADLARLFPGDRIRAERITLAPPIARALAPISTFTCDLLSLVPWLRTHILASIRPA